MDSLAEYESSARAVLDPATWAYLAGGAGSEETVRRNRAAYDTVELRPRIFRGECATPAIEVTILDQVLELPILLAPTSPQRLLHEHAELATARAAASAGTVSIVSNDSHYSFPAIAEASARTCWFQLYPYRSRRDVEATIDLAVRSGARALVVTADATYPARRLSMRRAGFRTPPYVDFGTLRMLGILDGEVPADGRLERLPLSWTDLQRIRRGLPIPLVVKGVIHPADARRCVDVGADAIIVSNHGGRQLDGVIPTLAALGQVADVVGDDCAVLLDGGIRSGVDVVKAIALGARAVCIGRPYLWGLAYGGEAGVAAVLALMRHELEDTLRQLGVPSLPELARADVAEVTWR